MMANHRTTSQIRNAAGLLLIVILAAGCDELPVPQGQEDLGPTYLKLRFDDEGSQATFTPDQGFFGEIAAFYDNEVVFLVQRPGRGPIPESAFIHIQPGKPKQLKLNRTYVDRKCELAPPPTTTTVVNLREIPTTPKGFFLVLDPDEPNECVSGAFRLTEIKRGADGRIQRLALDFEYTGIPNLGRIRGSLRYNALFRHSDLPTLLPDAQKKPWRGSMGLVWDSGVRDPRLDLGAPLSPEGARSAVNTGPVEPEAAEPVDPGLGTDPVSLDPVDLSDPFAGNEPTDFFPPDTDPYEPEVVSPFEPKPFEPDPYALAPADPDPYEPFAPNEFEPVADRIPEPEYTAPRDRAPAAPEPAPVAAPEYVDRPADPSPPTPDFQREVADILGEPFEAGPEFGNAPERTPEPAREQVAAKNREIESATPKTEAQQPAESRVAEPEIQNIDDLASTERSHETGTVAGNQDVASSPDDSIARAKESPASESSNSIAQNLSEVAGMIARWFGSSEDAPTVVAAVETPAAPRPTAVSHDAGFGFSVPPADSAASATEPPTPLVLNVANANSGTTRMLHADRPKLLPSGSGSRFESVSPSMITAVEQLCQVVEHMISILNALSARLTGAA